MNETFTIEHSIDTEDLFDSIAQELQDDNELDLSYDDILEKLQSNKDLCKFIDLSFKVVVDLDKKEIVDIY